MLGAYQKQLGRFQCLPFIPSVPPDQLNQNASYFRGFLPRCSWLFPKYLHRRLVSWAPGSFLRQCSWAVRVEKDCFPASMHNHLPCSPSCPASNLPPECCPAVLSEHHQDRATPGAPLCGYNEADASPELHGPNSHLWAPFPYSLPAAAPHTWDF